MLAYHCVHIKVFKENLCLSGPMVTCCLEYSILHPSLTGLSQVSLSLSSHRILRQTEPKVLRFVEMGLRIQVQCIFQF